ncbi:hypothetical protein SORDD25_00337 [Streptococcus oralis]|uniref:Uncharacterized protein n=1 Tax=Streptococcus oralis TaxID=1303 RepID=A0A139R1E1_STROR|nr:hypothetical protein SORDD25_00337 [Streptococcus oralis]
MNFQKAYCIKLSSLVSRLFLLLWGKKKKVPMFENLLFISF